METSTAVRPLTYWQLIELETARRLSEMRAEQARKRISRSVAELQSIGAPRFESVSR